MAQVILNRRIASAGVIRFTPIWSKMKNIKVNLLIGATGEEKTVTLDPTNWAVRILNYRRSAVDNGAFITTVGVEDATDPSRADDWKDCIIVLRQWLVDEVPHLLVQIFYLMYAPGNRCRVWYKDSLIYDSDTDGWKKQVMLPW